MTNAIRILGLDPGLRRTGWGVVTIDGARLSHVAHGVIAPDDKAALSERLLVIYRAVAEIVAAWSPDEAAIEETSVTANGPSTLKSSATPVRRGDAWPLAAAVFAVAEYAATVIKKGLVGTWRRG